MTFATASTQQATIASFRRAHERYCEEFELAYQAFGMAMTCSDWFDGMLMWKQVMKSGDIGEALVAWHRAAERNMDDAQQIRQRPN